MYYHCYSQRRAMIGVMIARSNHQDLYRFVPAECVQPSRPAEDAKIRSSTRRGSHRSDEKIKEKKRKM